MTDFSTTVDGDDQLCNATPACTTSKELVVKGNLKMPSAICLLKQLGKSFVNDFLQRPNDFVAHLLCT
jgi:hypothetical protein